MRGDKLCCHLHLPFHYTQPARLITALPRGTMTTKVLFHRPTAEITESPMACASASPCRA